MSGKNGPSLTIGSLEGDGQVYMGRENLPVGRNSLSMISSGVLFPGSPGGGTGGTGALSKIGSGTLTLNGANLYTAGTTVTSGTLVVGNTGGSATGTRAVQVSAGTLGGSGTTSGSVTHGKRDGSFPRAGAWGQQSSDDHDAKRAHFLMRTRPIPTPSRRRGTSRRRTRL